MFHRNSTHLLCPAFCDILNLRQFLSLMAWKQDFLFMRKLLLQKNLGLAPEQMRFFFFFFKFSMLMFRLCPLCVFVQSRRIQSCPETISVAFYLIVSVLWYFSKEKSNCLTYLLNYLHPPFGRGGLIL